MKEIEDRLIILEQKTNSLSSKVVLHRRLSCFLAMTLMVVLCMGAETAPKSLREEVDSIKKSVQNLRGSIINLKTRVTTNERKVKHIDPESRGKMIIGSNVLIKGGLRLQEGEGDFEIRATDGLGQKEHGLLHYTYGGNTKSIRTTRPIYNVNH